MGQIEKILQYDPRVGLERADSENDPNSKDMKIV